MIGGDHTVRIGCTPERLWDYMAEFSHWAPFVIGFQDLRQVDDKTAIWTLRGDVGILSRDVEIEVSVTEWVAGERAAFALNGITELLTGTGSFDVAADSDPGPDFGHTSGSGTDPVAEASADQRQPVPRRGGRLRRALARWWLRRARRRARGVVAPREVAPARISPTEEGAILTFRLAVAPGGAMAPMIEMLMAPLLEPAAEDLSLNIREAIEESAP